MMRDRQQNENETKPNSPTSENSQECKAPHAHGARHLPFQTIGITTFARSVEQTFRTSEVTLLAISN